MSRQRKAIDVAWEFKLGIHSNIPECCVRFYIDNVHRVTAINQRRGMWRDVGVHYVMCTSCLRRFRAGKIKANTLHMCRDSRDGPICHRYLSGPDRVAGLPLKSRYVREALPGVSLREADRETRSQ